MFKNSTAKKLYRFSKNVNHKISISTKDLNDSLDHVSRSPIVTSKHHVRTQSCPSGPPNLPEQVNLVPQQDTTRSFKVKPPHLKSHSQA